MLRCPKLTPGQLGWDATLAAWAGADLPGHSRPGSECPLSAA